MASDSRPQAAPAPRDAGSARSLFCFDEVEDWKNQPEEGVHSGGEDVSICVAHVMLRAVELGPVTCWCNYFANVKLEEALGQAIQGLALAGQIRREFRASAIVWSVRSLAVACVQSSRRKGLTMVKKMIRGGGILPESWSWSAMVRLTMASPRCWATWHPMHKSVCCASATYKRGAQTTPPAPC